MALNKTTRRSTRVLGALAFATLLTACETMPLAGGGSGQQQAAVGPLADMQWESSTGQGSQPSQVSQVFLNVAVPEFDTGFPLKQGTDEIDYDEVKEQGIWPQLRRTESKKFAFKTKRALEELGTFGSVSVTPDTKVPAELFVVGKILKSDSQEVMLDVRVQSISGAVLGQRTIEHTVSEGVLTDRRKDGINTYQPVFDKTANFVASVLKGLDNAERTELQQLGRVAYATKYSPESYKGFLAFKRGEISLTGLPAEGDPMMNRIEKLKTHEYLFIDRMQAQYEAFDQSTEDSYQQWQRSALAEVVRRDEAQNKKIGGILAAVVGVALAYNANKKGTVSGDFVRNVAVGAAAVGAATAIGADAEMDEQQRVINEMGESADLEMSPIEMEFEGQKSKLTGTAQEQYSQWRAHLKKIYELESGSLEAL